MGNGNDLDVVQSFAEDHRKRIPAEDYAASAPQVWRTNQRIKLQAAIRTTKFLIEPHCNGMALFPKPVEGGVRFRLSFRV